ncbi:bifunctional adenosylcobinamide kinase/adenosylcobinamide-phosphate guanylyltransferase [Bacillus solitudinis]|uniref:bifunctional adenosylcobinamide kinase/adenosylcobinamide-phosphate guanylyltransferase n=1 Tax=Bacillus solitudinis TaxID=2014074 RepID=UPI000C24AC77|nr:bifunctional adenosylcobinamide kinase/adenosylcobinamide-phosphate guanylyltransferase [Bacillus solitudinis]
MMIFITGGVRSGKSAYAEQLATSFQHQNKGQLYYIATSHVYDKEMERRIQLHEKQRQQSNESWKLIEKQTNLHEIQLFKKNDVFLVDCVTNLLSNELFAGWELGLSNWKEHQYQEDILEKLQQLVLTFKKSSAETILVSNELAYESLSQNKGTFTYIRLLGLLHQYIVQLADKAIVVESGLPIYMKGEEII